jgi:hypothetical protein
MLRLARAVEGINFCLVAKVRVIASPRHFDGKPLRFHVPRQIPRFNKFCGSRPDYERQTPFTSVSHSTCSAESVAGQTAGPARSPGGREAGPLEILRSDIRLREMGEKLDISISQAFRLKEQARELLAA